MAYGSARNDGGIEAISLAANLTEGSDNAANYTGLFRLTDKTTGVTTTLRSQVGAAPAGVSVQAPVVDGHSYSWTVHESAGPASGPSVGPCDFVADTVAPANPTVTSTDFPSTGSNLTTGQAGSFTLTSSDPQPATGSASGLRGFVYAFDSPLGVSDPVHPANADGTLTLSNQSFGWGEHFLYVAAVDVAGNHSVQIDYPFYVPENPQIVPALNLTAQDALSVHADGRASTSAYGPKTCSFDFGDHSGLRTSASCTYTHNYKKPGTYQVTLTVTVGTTQKSVIEQFTTVGVGYTPYGPKRLLDTRKSQGGTASELAHDGSIKLKVAGVGSIPTDVKAVYLNLTAVDATGNGYISATAGTGTAGIANLNYRKSAMFTNTVIAPVAADGTVTLTNTGATTSVTLDLIADVSGYFDSHGNSGYRPLGTEERVMDTKTGVGVKSGRLAAGTADVLTIAGATPQLPTTGITAVAVNVTAATTTGAGYLVLYPDGTSVPTASNLNWQTPVTKATAAVVPVGKDGKIDIYNGSADNGTADVLIDVAGYFTTANGVDAYVPVTAAQVLDTRTSSPIAASSTLTLNMAGLGGTPTAGDESVRAYVLNLTVTQTQAAGDLSLPLGATSPAATSTVNWTGSNQTVANLAFVNDLAESTDYLVEFHNGGGANSRPIQLIADVQGYFSAA